MRVTLLWIATLVLLLTSLACGGSQPAPKAAPSGGGASASDDTAPAMPTGQLTAGARDASKRQQEALREAELEALRKQQEAEAAARGETLPAPGDEAATDDGTSLIPGQTPIAPFESRDVVDMDNKIGVMRTTAGDIWFYFYPKDAPLHVKNFIYLATKGFYRDVRFHRIVPGFVIQGGEARADWSEPDVAIKLEANMKRIHIPGALAAARTSDPNSASTQFYFCITREATQGLDGQYTVYGQAFRGQEVINDIGASEANQNSAKIIDCQIFDATPFMEEIAAYKSNRSITD